MPLPSPGARIDAAARLILPVGRAGDNRLARASPLAQPPPAFAAADERPLFASLALRLSPGCAIGTSMTFRPNRHAVGWLPRFPRVAKLAGQRTAGPGPGTET